MWEKGRYIDLTKRLYLSLASAGDSGHLCVHRAFGLVFSQLLDFWHCFRWMKNGGSHVR